MPPEYPAPRLAPRIMVSSTFKDLEQHRAALIDAIQKQSFAAVVMENDTAKPIDVIDSSIKMVQDASAYILVIGVRYGQIPKDKNPNQVSVTELEFDEALRIGRPILLFLMGPDHPIGQKDQELDSTIQAKLEAFRERAKQISPNCLVNRVYDTFNSLDEFRLKCAHAVAGLTPYLSPPSPPIPPVDPTSTTLKDRIPAPPTLYAQPDYIGSHDFVGRHAELSSLSDWAQPASPHTVLLFDAIGGSGKSMLTWHWATRKQPRTDWAGIFWYSFYERRAQMADFCRHALAYMTGQPVESLQKLKTPELAPIILDHLQQKPWLFILDGLERILVAYNDINAPELSDESANNPTDPIADRDPRCAIRPEDDDFLHDLTAAAPSRILITSRLIPSSLINKSGTPIPSVRQLPLTGLNRSDAEKLLRSCNISGDAEAIQAYLQTNCDCHPLTIGFIAGLVNDYGPEPGNFDRWATDPDYGGALNLAELNLTDRRNHILTSAIDRLSKENRQLLSTLALLAGGADYATLEALNPHLPPEPNRVEKPDEPFTYPGMSEDDRAEAQAAYNSELEEYKRHRRDYAKWQSSPEVKQARKRLDETLKDLKSRGLLQYDPAARRYDLHPVVRNVASGKLKTDERELYGDRIIDHFNSRPHNPWEEAETLEDVETGLQVVRTLLKLGRFQQAADTLTGDLSRALLFNLEAHAEYLSLLRLFFPTSWGSLPATVESTAGAYLANDAALALGSIDQSNAASEAFSALIEASLTSRDWAGLCPTVSNTMRMLPPERRLVRHDHLLQLIAKLAEAAEEAELIFRARMDQFAFASGIGDWQSADSHWAALDPMGRRWHRRTYRTGEAECHFAWSQFYRGSLAAETLAHAERLCREGKDRASVRGLHGLRGLYHLNRAESHEFDERTEWELAAASFKEAVRMSREVGQNDMDSETLLALAKYHLGQLADPRAEAERLASVKNPSILALGKLWLAIGDRTEAKKHATTAYELAWHDGGRYVYRYSLDQAKALLNQLEVPIPEFPIVDPETAPRFPWEADVEAALAKLKAEKASKPPPGAP